MSQQLRENALTLISRSDPAVDMKTAGQTTLFTVPTGLTGVEATFKSFGYLTGGRLGRSNPEVVTFQ